MKPVDVKSSTYIDSSDEINDEDAKFKIGEFKSVLKNKNEYYYIFLEKGSYKNKYDK